MAVFQPELAAHNQAHSNYREANGETVTQTLYGKTPQFSNTDAQAYPTDLR